MPTTVQAVTSGQGRVVIPAEVRRALGITTGTPLTFTVRDDEVVISTPASAVRKLQAMFADTPRIGVRASDELIARRRAEVAREESE